MSSVIIEVKSLCVLPLTLTRGGGLRKIILWFTNLLIPRPHLGLLVRIRKGSCLGTFPGGDEITLPTLYVVSGSFYDEEM